MDLDKTLWIAALLLTISIVGVFAYMYSVASHPDVAVELLSVQTQSK